MKVHADDDNFQSGSSQGDLDDEFQVWYREHKSELMELTRVSGSNKGIMKALEQAFYGREQRAEENQGCEFCDEQRDLSTYR